MMKCRQCGTEFKTQGRVLFRERCSNCDAALHVCLQCSFFDTAAYNGCREPKAERLVEKDRENRCEYFNPGDGVQSPESGKDGAKKAFDDLFG